MKNPVLLAMAALALLLAGCLPVASLQTAEPVSGHEISVGLTAVAGTGSDPSVGALPYLAYAWGNGETEFSISTQVGLRGGVKRRLAKNFSLAGGLTIPWLFFSEGAGGGLPFTADVSLLFSPQKRLTLAARGMYAYLGASLGNVWLGGAGVTYDWREWLFEGGLLFSQKGGPLFSVSAAYRF